MTFEKEQIKTGIIEPFCSIEVYCSKSDTVDLYAQLNLFDVLFAGRHYSFTLYNF